MERNNIKPLKIVNNGNSFIIQNTEIGQPSTEKKQIAHLGRTERRIIKINVRNSRIESEMDTDSGDSQNWLPAKSTKPQNSKKRKIITQNTTGKAVEEKKAVKPPPIYIDAEIIDPLLELLDETIGKNNYVIKKLKDNQVKVQTTTPDTFRKSKPLLYKKSPSLCNGSTNWMIFKETLESKLNCNIPLKTSSQIDNAVNNLTDAIQEAAWASTSQKVTSRDFPTYPSNILHKIKIKRQYLRTHYGLTVKVVFDGYSDSTKNIKAAEQRRRTTKTSSGSEIIFDEFMTVPENQQQFFTNINNKSRFISMLSNKLTAANIAVKQAKNDADVLIIETAIEKFDATNTTIVVGEDVDLLVLLTARTPMDKIIYFLKPGRAQQRTEIYSSKSLSAYPKC
ncbi:hypothetical protein M0804_006606 [Polistes exclamans]|nr:hypothetical protein M0804_006606 [Polistes exclamans]